MIVDELIQTTALVRDYMDKESQHAIIRFVRSRWNPDGGVRGHKNQSDLYYTVFAAICMRALRGCIPLLRLWKYIQSFGDGASLDVFHLFCLIRLRSIYPMSDVTRYRLLDHLDEIRAESASDMFFKVVMAEYLRMNDRPEAHLTISNDDSTIDLAAAAVINHQPDKTAEALLMQRYSEVGGFCSTVQTQMPDLYSTATALFALKVMNANLSSIHDSCLAFVESLQRDSGGFVCRAIAEEEDTECTFYALLSLGCLFECA